MLLPQMNGHEESTEFPTKENVFAILQKRSVTSTFHEMPAVPAAACSTAAEKPHLEFKLYTATYLRHFCIVLPQLRQHGPFPPFGRLSKGLHLTQGRVNYSRAFCSL